MRIFSSLIIMRMPMKIYIKILEKLCLIIIILMTMPSCVPYELTTPIPTQSITHTPNVVNASLQGLWNIKGAFLLWNRLDLPLDAAFGMVCYLGDLEIRDHGERIICLDDLNGEVAWNIQSGTSRSLVISPDGVIVTYSSPASVKKYNLQTGDLDWRKNLSGSGSLYLQYLNDEIQVLTEPEVFWVINPDSTVKYKVGGRHIFVSTSDVTYISRNGLQAYQSGTDDLLWEFNKFKGVHAPLFADNKIFLRDGEWQGPLYTLDVQNGKLLWSADKIFGNVVYSPEKKRVYALRENGDLIALDPDNGAETLMVKFTSVSFQADTIYHTYVYHLAYDPSNQILMVSLGDDSNQLFAFKEN